jgi:2-iminobutanoate/2-iminopropanoate deaminase
VKANGFVFVSGQLALRPGETALLEGGIAEQTEQVLANLRAILEEAGSSLENLVKTTVFLQRLDDFAGMNEVYARHVGDRPPARSTVEVAKLPSGALVEIEAIALVP